ncbi:hypothetical protein DH2020_013613 [Rehmannia glutinosa]|uniref:Auxin efflux carrier component n=1 Tax=Rehmannia glutinosa TaxID=99300 RepID=A0ABR0X5X1_REHGL
MFRHKPLRRAIRSPAFIFPLHSQQQPLHHEPTLHRSGYPPKLIVLAVLAIWANFSKRGGLEWTITLFSLSTLPNTLVMGIPLLKGMYGEFSGSEAFDLEQFPDTAGSIVSIHVDSDVMSLDGRHPLETEAEIKEDGKLHVTVRKSNASRSDIFSRRNSNFGANDVYGLSASRGPTPRPSNFEEETGNNASKPRFYHGGNNNVNNSNYPAPNPGMFSPTGGSKANGAKKPMNGQHKNEEGGGKDLHMFVWSSSASPVSDVFGGGHDYGALDQQHASGGKEVRVAVSPTKAKGQRDNNQEDYLVRDEFSFGNRGGDRENEGEKVDENKIKVMPPASVMTRLILIMVWRKLIRNPNTYSSLIGLTWSLVSFRWNVEMPAIIAKSISILSDAGLGMAMFSLGLFMALQPRIIACGNSVATFAMAVRFLTGPAVMAAASIAVGLRGAALPQGIVPFVFAKEYNVYPDILSTA